MNYVLNTIVTSLGFWLFIAPCAIVFFVIGTVRKGAFVGLGISVVFLVLSSTSACAIDYFLIGSTDSASLQNLHFKRRALLDIVPWPIGVAIGCLPFLMAKYLEDREWKRFLANSQRSE